MKTGKNSAAWTIRFAAIATPEAAKMAEQAFNSAVFDWERHAHGQGLLWARKVGRKSLHWAVMRALEFARLAKRNAQCNRQVRHFLTQAAGVLFYASYVHFAAPGDHPPAICALHQARKSIGDDRPLKAHFTIFGQYLEAARDDAWHGRKDSAGFRLMEAIGLLAFVSVTWFPAAPVPVLMSLDEVRKPVFRN